MMDRSAGFSQGGQLLSARHSDFQISTVTSLARVAVWFKFNTTPVHGTYYEIVRAGDASVASDGWTLQYDGASNQIAFAYSNGTGYANGLSNLDPVAGQWYFCVAGPGTGSTVMINLWDTTHALPGGSTPVTGPINTAAPLPALKLSSVVAGALQFPGELDSLGWWPDRQLTNAEMLALWNNGLGLRYQGGAVAAANGGSLLTGLKAWYDLDDFSGAGVWQDRLGNHPLTASGFVSSQPPRGQ